MTATKGGRPKSPDPIREQPPLTIRCTQAQRRRLERVASEMMHDPTATLNAALRWLIETYAPPDMPPELVPETWVRTLGTGIHRRVFARDLRYGPRDLPDRPIIPGSPEEDDLLAELPARTTHWRTWALADWGEGPQWRLVLVGTGEDVRPWVQLPPA